MSFVGDIVGGILGARASKKAGKLQYQAAQEGIAENRRQFDVTREDLSPWLAAGKQALGASGNLLGLNGMESQDMAISALRESPLFKSLFGAGQEAVLQSAAATGGLRGGNVQHSLYDLGEDTLARTIERQLGWLGGISGTGQNTGVQLGQFGANNAAAIANLLGAGSKARAEGVLGSASGWSSAIGSIFDTIGGSKFGKGISTALGLPF